VSTAIGGTFKPANYTIRYIDGSLTVMPLTLPASMVTASTTASNSFDPIALPDNAHAVIGVPPVVTGPGGGLFYADPRFATPFVCFGGGYGMAQSCFPVRQ
jgi:hypothetical protein